MGKLGRYEIVSELGKGAMGIIYKAHDPVLERVVAIKTINLSLAEGELHEFEARFYQEAKAAGRLTHPNIVTIYDVDRSADMAFIAMEYLEGKELREILDAKPTLPMEWVADIAAQVADGLAYAHEHQIVHRDIKPSNIMIVRDQLAKITDFGIARMRSAEVRTQTGTIMGSPKYMSPEQVIGKRVDHRSDIFSLGIVLYEMLTGSAPFNGESIHAIMYQTINVIPEPPSLSNPATPEIMDFIVAKALAKNLEERYQNAKDMAEDLRQCKNQLLLSAQKTSTPAQTSSTETSKRVTLIDAQEKDKLLSQPVMVTRCHSGGSQSSDPTPTLGISKHFDSFDATMRMATQAGLAAEFDEYARTQRIHPSRAGASKGFALATGTKLLQAKRLLNFRILLWLVITVVVLLALIRK